MIISAAIYMMIEVSQRQWFEAYIHEKLMSYLAHPEITSEQEMEVIRLYDAMQVEYRMHFPGGI